MHICIRYLTLCIVRVCYDCLIESRFILNKLFQIIDIYTQNGNTNTSTNINRLVSITIKIMATTTIFSLTQ